MDPWVCESRLQELDKKHKNTANNTFSCIRFYSTVKKKTELKRWFKLIKGAAQEMLGLWPYCELDKKKKS